MWDGARWSLDSLGIVNELAKDIGFQMLDEAKKLDDSARMRLAQHASRTLQDRGVRSMLRSAQTLPGIALPSEAFDADPLAFNCQNGVFELPTGRFAAHHPSQLHRKVAHAAYEPGAGCPRWLRFLGDVFAGDAELIDYLQKLVGYCLTGSRTEDKVFLLFGSGRNGKGVFADTIEDLLGDYAKHLSSETLLEQRGTGNTYDLARLPRVRLAVASETDRGRRFSSALLKQLTGGDRLAARDIYCRQGEYLPQFKIMLNTNFLPRVDPDDLAMWERTVVIPFSVYIPPDRRDPDLRAKLRAEFPGILNWALEGYRRWAADGLGTPSAAVLRANAAYERDVDPVKGFVEEQGLADPNATTAFSDLYSKYLEWTVEQGESSLTAPAFGKKLDRMGFSSRKGTGGVRVRAGITFRSGPSLTVVPDGTGDDESSSGVSGASGATFQKAS